MEADAIVGDGEASDLGLVDQPEIVLAVDIDDDPRVGRRRFLDRLIGVHDGFEHRQQRLPLGKIGLPDLA